MRCAQSVIGDLSYEPQCQSSCGAFGTQHVKEEQVMSSRLRMSKQKTRRTSWAHKDILALCKLVLSAVSSLGIFEICKECILKLLSYL